MSTAGLQRGDVVVVNFTPTNPNATVRPALVIQNDRDNNRMANTIVVQITSNTRGSAEDTQLLIDQSHPDWTASGLHRPSAVNCSNIATVPGDERGWVEKPGRFREADVIANKTV